MPGVLLQPVQIDSKSGLLTLFDHRSQDVWSPSFEITSRPYMLVAYGLIGAQKATVYHIARLPNGIKQSPFIYDGTPLELTANSPNVLLAASGTYRVTLSGGVGSVVLLAIPQVSMVDSPPSPNKSAEVRVIELEAGVFSEAIQVYSRPRTIALLDPPVWGVVEVYISAGGLLTPYSVLGAPVVLSESNTTVFLDRTGEYVFKASLGCTLLDTINYISFLNPYINKGEKGDIGPAGPAGPAGVAVDYIQSAPSDTWTINHNLGFNPSVELLTTGGAEFEANVVHTSVNQTVVYIAMPLAGKARLN